MKTLIYVDIETGGLEWYPTPECPTMRPILQIAAVAISLESGQEYGAHFNAYIQFKPESCHPEALKVCYEGKETKWDSAQHPADVARNFARWLSDRACITKTSKAGKPYHVAKLAGYNIAAFDGPFLWAWFRTFKQFLPADFIYHDVMQRYHVLDSLVNTGAICYWSESGYKLSAVAEQAGHSLRDAHDALDDIRATIAVDRWINSQFKSLISTGHCNK